MRWICLMIPVLMAPTIGAARGDEPEEPRLRASVATLASKEFAGRAEEGGAKSADYLVQRFREFGLAPAFEKGGYRQDIIAASDGEKLGQNVAGIRPGTDPRLRGEWVIVSAHYDHLGILNGNLYPGADDNASGVAMLLEVARTLPPSPRSVAFVGFDREEDGLWGSRYFADHPPIPLDKVKLVIVADMIGRSLSGIFTKHLFITGTERMPILRGWLAEDAEGLPLELGMIGTDIVGTRSDYAPFRAREIPFLFFSTGESREYHSRRDVPETLDYPKLAAGSRLIARLTARVAGAKELPGWSKETPPSREEALALRGVFTGLLEHKADLGLSNFHIGLTEGAIRRIDKALEKGEITPADRTAIVRTAQLLLVSAL